MLQSFLSALPCLVHIQCAEVNPCVSDCLTSALQGDAQHEFVTYNFMFCHCVSWSQISEGHVQVQVNAKAARAVMRLWPHKSVLISVMGQPLSWFVLMLSNKF